MRDDEQKKADIVKPLNNNDKGYNKYRSPEIVALARQSQASAKVKKVVQFTP